MKTIIDNLSVIQEAIQGAESDYREARLLTDARAREIAWYKRDALLNESDDWASFCDEGSAETLLAIWRSMNLPDAEFKQRVQRLIVDLIERNAETHADIVESNHRL